MATTMKAKLNNERDESIKRLRCILRPGMRVHGIVKHVARSGTFRHIDFYLLKNQDCQWLSGWIAKALEYSQTKGGALKISGCGMDMVFNTIYETARILWPDGFDCIGEGCPSCDHSNGDRDHMPHRHKDGGYALRYGHL